MNHVHWHLLLSHAPLFGTIGGFGLLTFGVIWKHRVLERAGLLVLMMAALISIPVYLTGEGAEEAVEHMAGFSEQAVEQHEGFAKTTYYMMLALGVLALVTWFARSFGKVAMAVRWLAVLMSAVMVCMVSVTAWYGGKAAHEEIRNGSVQDLFSPGSDASGAAGVEGDED